MATCAVMPEILFYVTWRVICDVLYKHWRYSHLAMDDVQNDLKDCQVKSCIKYFNSSEKTGHFVLVRFFLPRPPSRPIISPNRPILYIDFLILQSNHAYLPAVPH